MPRFDVPPLDGPLVVTSPFGPRAAPVPGASTDHKGIDLRARVGDPVRAPARALVARTRSTAAGGHEVRLELEDGALVDLLHLSDVFVHEGQTVEAGAIVAEAGATGNVSGPHLHLGLVVGGAYVDPAPYLARWLNGGGAGLALLLVAVAALAFS